MILCFDVFMFYVFFYVFNVFYVVCLVIKKK